MTKNLLIILLISIATNVFCSDAEQFCNYLNKAKLETKELNKNKSNPFWSRLFSTSVTTPQFTEFKLETDEILHSSEKREIKNLNNYIILFHPKNISQILLSKEIALLEADKSEFLRLDNNLSELLETEGISECIETYYNYPVTEERYNQAYNALLGHQEANDSILVEQTKQQILSAKKRGLLNKWEVIDTFDLDEIYMLMSQRTTGNIIIVAHSIKETKSLVDSSGRVVPRNFFNQISDTIQSINIFSCHSQNSVSNFNIVDLFQNTPTIQKRRFFSNLKVNTIGNKAPVQNFRGYLKKVDRKIGLAKKRNIKSQRFSKKKNIRTNTTMCPLEIDTNYEENDLSVTLNHRFIGTIKLENNKFKVPCTFLDRRDSQVITLSKIAAKKIKTNNQYSFNITLSNPTFEYELKDQFIRTKSQSRFFMGAKFTFIKGGNHK